MNGLFLLDIHYRLTLPQTDHEPHDVGTQRAVWKWSMTHTEHKTRFTLVEALERVPYRFGGWQGG